MCEAMVKHLSNQAEQGFAALHDFLIINFDQIPERLRPRLYRVLRNAYLSLDILLEEINA